MKDLFKFKEIAKTELDPNKSYILKLGNLNELGPEGWNNCARAIQQCIRDIGIQNVLIMPYDIDTELFEQEGNN